MIAYPFGLYPILIVTCANMMLLFRKCGIPTYSGIMQYAQKAIMYDEFNNLMYILSTFMASNSLFVNGPLIITACLAIAPQLHQIIV